MPYTAGAKNLMLDELAGLVTHVSLHTASPGSTGANEATGGSPAYARKAVTWDPASGGSAALADPVTFDVAAGSYTHIGLWGASTEGTFYGYDDITTATFGGQGTYTVDSGSIDLNATASA